MDLREHKIKEKNLDRHPWEEVRSEIIFDIIRRECKELLKRPATIIDIGCGDVYLTQILSHKMPKAGFYAVDNAFSAEDFRILQSKFKSSNIRLYNSVKEVNIPEKAKADLILLTDVIEHIDNDSSFLKYLNTLSFVGPETVFLITVPAFQILFSSHDIFLGHYRRYTATLLKNNIKKSGLSAFKTGYFFTSLLLPRVLQKLVEKISGKQNAKGLAGWKGNKFMGALLKNILRIDYFLSRIISKTGIKLPGLSVYALCKRSA
jgi:hypothetical protein